jgi:DNA-binding MurR/RpiR family transcriptional regulator
MAWIELQEQIRLRTPGALRLAWHNPFQAIFFANESDATMKGESLLQRISQTALGNSPALEKVGLWVAAHPLRVISMSADEVAQHSGGSLAAVNRFARSAGFEGFAHLKAALAEELHETSEPIRKLTGGGEASRPKGKPADGGLFAHAEANLRLAAQASSVALLDQAARRMLKSRQVFALGLGLGNAMAQAASHLLLPYLQSISLVAGEGGTEVAARRLMRVTPQDTLFAISLPRYSRDTVALARYARERGAHVIVLTDKTGAPLAMEADMVLVAPAAHDVLSASAVAMLAVIEALAARVMQLNPDAALLATELSEAVLEHLSVGKGKTWI